MALDDILRQIANPQTPNYAGSFGQGLGIGQGIKKSGQDDEQREKVEFANTVNQALTATGAQRQELLQLAKQQTQPGSRQQIAIDGLLSAPLDQQEASLNNIRDLSLQEGLLQPLESKDTRTPDIKNYEFAKSQGYTGSFTDFQKKDGVDRDARTAEIKNFEYGQKNPEFKEMRKKADESKLTDHELRLATMLANGDIDASQLPKRGGTYNKIVSGAKELNPELNIRSGTADYVLSKNPTFRQKAMTAEVLPDIMGHIVEAGKKVDFSNIRKFGNLQKFYKENVNDPDLVEYMALRNDGLMEIASVMRGAGMTDKAHEAEVEAMNPTLSPRGLDAWYNAQMKALKPRLKIIDKIISGKGKKNTTSDPLGIR